MNTSPGAILLLLLAVFLFLQFFTGGLEWLFAMGRAVQSGYRAPAGPAATPPAAPTYWPPPPQATRRPPVYA